MFPDNLTNLITYVQCRHQRPDDYIGIPSLLICQVCDDISITGQSVIGQKRGFSFAFFSFRLNITIWSKLFFRNEIQKDCTMYFNFQNTKLHCGFFQWFNFLDLVCWQFGAKSYLQPPAMLSPPTLHDENWNFNATLFFSGPVFNFQFNILRGNVHHSVLPFQSHLQPRLCLFFTVI